MAEADPSNTGLTEDQKMQLKALGGAVEIDPHTPRVAPTDTLYLHPKPSLTPARLFGLVNLITTSRETTQSAAQIPSDSASAEAMAPVVTARPTREPEPNPTLTREPGLDVDRVLTARNEQLAPILGIQSTVVTSVPDSNPLVPAARVEVSTPVSSTPPDLPSLGAMKRRLHAMRAHQAASMGIGLTFEAGTSGAPITEDQSAPSSAPIQVREARTTQETSANEGAPTGSTDSPEPSPVSPVAPPSVAIRTVELDAEEEVDVDVSDDTPVPSAELLAALEVAKARFPEGCMFQRGRDIGIVSAVYLSGNQIMLDTYEAVANDEGKFDYRDGRLDVPGYSLTIDKFLRLYGSASIEPSAVKNPKNEKEIFVVLTAKVSSLPPPTPAETATSSMAEDDEDDDITPIEPSKPSSRNWRVSQAAAL